MTRKAIIAAAAIALCACTGKTQAGAPQTDSAQATMGTTSNALPLSQEQDLEASGDADGRGLSFDGADPARQGLTFSTRPEKNSLGRIARVFITITTPNGKTYEEVALANEQGIAGADYWGEVEEVDINFDGTPDLTLAMGTFSEKNGAPKTILVRAWTWNTSRHCLEEVENFPWNPAIDEDNQRILARKAMYDGSQDYVPYYWRGSQLTPDYDQRWNSGEKYDDPFPLPEECLYSRE